MEAIEYLKEKKRMTEGCPSSFCGECTIVILLKIASIVGIESIKKMINKEILFKAKRLDNGQWIEGYYVYHIKRTIYVLDDTVKPEDEEHIIIFDDFSDWGMSRGIQYVHVDPKTLHQFSGKFETSGEREWKKVEAG